MTKATPRVSRSRTSLDALFVAFSIDKYRRNRDDEIVLPEEMKQAQNFAVALHLLSRNEERVFDASPPYAA